MIATFSSWLLGSRHDYTADGRLDSLIENMSLCQARKDELPSSLACVEARIGGLKSHATFSIVGVQSYALTTSTKATVAHNVKRNAYF